MKWFKHLVDSTSDPDFMESEILFGTSGPYVFWRTLEILARENAVESPLEINEKVFRAFFPSIKPGRLWTILGYFSDKKRLNFDQTTETCIAVFCPKLRDISSDYMRKVQKSSSASPKSIPPRRRRASSPDGSSLEGEKKGPSETSSLPPPPAAGNGTGKELPPGKVKKKLPSERGAVPKGVWEAFENFWAVYPKKVGKQAAARAYQNALGKATHTVILEGLVKQVNYLAGKEEKYKPHASTWLNGGRWADELEASGYEKMVADYEDLNPEGAPNVNGGSTNF